VQGGIMYEGESLCFDIRPVDRGQITSRDGVSDSPQSVSPRSRQVIVSVYAEPANDAGLRPPIASFEFGFVERFADAQWLLDSTGDHEGWIAVPQGETELMAAPWSTSALIRLGHDIRRGFSTSSSGHNRR
jgi:hypothetical protein